MRRARQRNAYLAALEAGILQLSERFGGTKDTELYPDCNPQEQLS